MGNSHKFCGELMSPKSTPCGLCGLGGHSHTWNVVVLCCFPVVTSWCAWGEPSGFYCVLWRCFTLKNREMWPVFSSYDYGQTSTCFATSPPVNIGAMVKTWSLDVFGLWSSDDGNPDSGHMFFRKKNGWMTVPWCGKKKSCSYIVQLTCPILAHGIDVHSCLWSPWYISPSFASTFNAGSPSVMFVDL